MSKDARTTYKIAGPATWELIRAAYLGGESARVVAERYGVGAHAVRKRITLEKWTKRDYAAALEARGVCAAPAPSVIVQAAEPFAELISALRAASATAQDGKVQAPGLRAEGEPAETAAQLERRALAQVGAALAKGRAGDAKALAALGDQMRKRAEAEREAARSGRRGLDGAERKDLVAELFAKAAYIAGAMVHAPSMAPAAFLGLIKEWRQINLGEGEADAEAAAAQIAEAQKDYLSGAWALTMPEEVRVRLQGAWAAEVADIET